ncbi:efflux RND transporter periplasmic adaptor subunit [Parabacteroides sp. OttesenSCG-928-G07]|nr:efflux RND transporter periplasmic adaptor subunit [Parabacteroides sp. OttesenSCG-928-G07]
MKKIIIPIIALSLLSIACQKQQNATSQEVTITNTSVSESIPEEDFENDMTLAATTTANQISFNGILTVSPQHHATITLTMGGTVHSTSLLAGNYIRKGTILATLENPEFISLQQSYLEAYAQTEYLETEYRRQERLSAQEVASQKRFQESKAEYLSMKSRLEAASAQLTILGIDPKELLNTGIRPYLEVKSPLNGYVTGLNINLGKYVSPGEPICEVVNKEETLLHLTAYEKDIDNLKIGALVEFRVNGIGEETFNAEIISIGQAVDRVNRSFEVYAKVKEANSQFRPGMYVTAHVEKR